MAKISLFDHKKGTYRCFPQPGQREGQGQAQPEGLRGGPEVKDEDVTGGVVRAGGHDPEEEHHGEEAAPTDGEVKQRGGLSEPDVEQKHPAEVRRSERVPCGNR